MSEEQKKEPGLLDVAKSVMWAFLGVQKQKNYERDFSHGKPWQYIVLGLIGVAIFITIVVTAVKFAMSLAGV